MLDYNFGNFKLEVTTLPTVVHDGVTPGGRRPRRARTSSRVATFNVENLDPSDPQAKFDRLAGLIVEQPAVARRHRGRGDPGQQRRRPTTASSPPTPTLDKLIAAIQAAGGPTYEWRADRPGQRPGRRRAGRQHPPGLPVPHRPRARVRRPPGRRPRPTATAVVGPALGAAADASAPAGSTRRTRPGTRSRKPLAGEFIFNGQHLFVIANHFNSKGGDEPLFGRFQPPTAQLRGAAAPAGAGRARLRRRRSSPPTRTRTSSSLGDLNDFEFSDTRRRSSRARVLNDLIDTLPPNERYSYVFEGNSQALDHILVSTVCSRPAARLRRRARQRRVRRPGQRPRPVRRAADVQRPADSRCRRAVHGRRGRLHGQRHAPPDSDPERTTRSPTRGISTTTAASRRPARARPSPPRRSPSRASTRSRCGRRTPGGLTRRSTRRR